jgi:hypothetical protein
MLPSDIGAVSAHITCIVAVHADGTTVLREVLAVRSDVALVGPDVIAVRAEIGTILRNVPMLRLDVALVGPDVIAVRAEIGAILRNVPTLRLDVALVGPDVIAVRAEIGAILRNVPTVRVDCGASLIDFVLLIRTGALLGIVVPQVTLLGSQVGFISSYICTVGPNVRATLRHALLVGLQIRLITRDVRPVGANIGPVLRNALLAGRRIHAVFRSIFPIRALVTTHVLPDAAVVWHDVAAICPQVSPVFSNISTILGHVLPIGPDVSALPLDGISLINTLALALIILPKAALVGTDVGSVPRDIFFVGTYVRPIALDILSVLDVLLVVCWSRFDLSHLRRSGLRCARTSVAYSRLDWYRCIHLRPW